MRRPRSTTLASLTLVAAASTALVACGSNNGQQGATGAATTQQTTQQPVTPAVTAVCTAGRQLSSSVQTVATAIQNGNVSAARGALPAAIAAASSLKVGLNQVQSEEKAKLDPQIATLTTQLQQARNASSPDELRTALTQAASTASGLTSTLNADLRCPPA